MSREHFNDLIHKVEEIKALFTIGQRIVPFLEELFKFVQETAPIINDMNESIKESTKKMPKATQQLDKVTEETELATTEMLDRIDTILAKITETTNSIKGYKEANNKKDELFESIKKEFEKYKFENNDILSANNITAVKVLRQPWIIWPNCLRLQCSNRTRIRIHALWLIRLVGCVTCFADALTVLSLRIDEKKDGRAPKQYGCVTASHILSNIFINWMIPIRT